MCSDYSVWTEAAKDEKRVCEEQSVTEPGVCVLCIFVIIIIINLIDRLCGLVVRVSGYR